MVELYIFILYVIQQLGKLQICKTHDYINVVKYLT